MSANRGSTTELTGWALVLLGTVLAIASGRQMANLFNPADAWSKTSATVVRTRLAEPVGASARGSRVYQEIVYFVDGNRFQESLEIGRFERRDEAAAFLAQAGRSGSVLTVWVQSRNPSRVQSTPVRDEASIVGIALYALLGLISLQIGGGFILAGYRKTITAEGVANVSGAPLPSV